MAGEITDATTEPGAAVPVPVRTDADAPSGRELAQRERRKRIAALKQELVDGDLLTAAEVAEILDVHPRTVGEYIRDGKLRAFQFGGSWRISENALRAFVRDLPRRCSFCGKEELQVHRLIAGPNGAYICDGCVAQCNEILAKGIDESRGWGGQ